MRRRRASVLESDYRRFPVENEKKGSSLPTLTDEDIKTAGLDRRSFLTKVGLGSAAVASAALAPSCGGSDDCDLDPTDPCSTDSD